MRSCVFFWCVLLSLVSSVSFAEDVVRSTRSNSKQHREKGYGLIVKMAQTRNQNNSPMQILSQTSAAKVSKMDSMYGGMHRLQVSNRNQLRQVMNELKTRSDVVYAVEDHILSATFGRKKSPPDNRPVLNFPNDTKLQELWHIIPSKYKKGHVGSIDVLDLWKNNNVGNKNVIIAVIDTGVDTKHSELKDNIFVNADEIAGNGVDDDRNGYIDDVKGWNFVANSNNANDDQGHGSHVAGIIGAKGNNAAGVAGVVWKASVLPVKVLDAEGSGYSSDVIKGIQYATAMGANIINLSLGSYQYSQAEYDALKAARDAGVLVVAAAGNDGTDNDADAHYPSSYALSNIIAVAASNGIGGIVGFSNYGKKSVHIAAPGHNIYSTYMNGQYASLSGTSMATPVVVGIAALVLADHPELSLSQLRNRVIRCGKAIQKPNYKKLVRQLIANADQAYHEEGCLD